MLRLLVFYSNTGILFIIAVFYGTKVTLECTGVLCLEEHGPILFYTILLYSEYINHLFLFRKQTKFYSIMTNSVDISD
jgi:hypothetical protein